MRYLAIAVVLAVLTGACRGDGPQTSNMSSTRDPAASSPYVEDRTPGTRLGSATPCAPAPTGDDDTIAKMVLSDDDIPVEVGSFGDTAVTRDKECALWGASTTAARQYDAPEPFPAHGAQRVIVTASLHSSTDQAKQELDWASGQVSQENLERLLPPEWHLLSFENLSVELGEQRKVIHYVAVNAEGLVFLETYWTTFRRENATAVLNVRAPLDNISMQQFEALATKLDQRVWEGLRSLQ